MTWRTQVGSFDTYRTFLAYSPSPEVADAFCGGRGLHTVGLERILWIVAVAARGELPVGWNGRFDSSVGTRCHRFGADQSYITMDGTERRFRQSDEQAVLRNPELF